ncbi:GNAT family N-acetyltransferase [Mesorhizobium sp. ZMM04-5]|uniref:GNAT family N-acetyltransferase n=1 Tax=Mesorhizobium marinum TaxID=3228790 RepID=A0ABV3R361_9HYPH
MNAHTPTADRTATEPLTFTARQFGSVGEMFAFGAGRSGGHAFLNERFLGEIGKRMLDERQRLVLVGVADQDGSPVAAFAFQQRRKFGVATLEAVDFGIVDYFAPAYFGNTALSAADTAKLWRAVTKAVPGVHAVAFKKMPRLLYDRPHALSGAAFLKPMGTSATTLRLRGPGRPSVVPEKMSLAREVRRKSKKLEKIGPLTFEEARTNAEVDEAMATMVAFRTARFAELGRHDALLDPRVVAFYRSLADRDGDVPLARMFTLRTGAVPVAVIYGISHGDVFTLIVPSITTCREAQSGSPGLVGLFKTLQWCRDQDFAVFDLSVGTLGYKSRFDAETNELFEYQQALTPLGLPVVAEARLRRWVRHLAVRYPQVRSTLEGFGRKGRSSAPAAAKTNGDGGN